MDLIVKQNDELTLQPEFEQKLVAIKKAAKKIKEEDKKLTDAIREEMVRKQYKGISTSSVSITYIAPTYTEGFDLERFRLDHPDMYDEYIKIKPKSATVRVTVKD